MQGVRIANVRPTKIDVDKLIARFGVPQENETILWSEIIETTGLEKQEYRFGTVLTAWRKHLEQNHDIILYPVPGVGLAVAVRSGAAAAATACVDWFIIYIPRRPPIWLSDSRPPK